MALLVGCTHHTSCVLVLREGPAPECNDMRPTVRRGASMVHLQRGGRGVSIEQTTSLSMAPHEHIRNRHKAIPVVSIWTNNITFLREYDTSGMGPDPSYDSDGILSFVNMLDLIEPSRKTIFRFCDHVTDTQFFRVWASQYVSFPTQPHHHVRHIVQNHTHTENQTITATSYPWNTP